MVVSCGFLHGNHITMVIPDRSTEKEDSENLDLAV